MKNKKTHNSILSSIVLTIYFAELVFPILNTFIHRATVCLVCFLIWVFLCYTMDTHYLKRTSVFPVLIIYISLIGTSYLLGYSTIGNRYADMSLVLCGTIIYQFYFTHDRLEDLKKPIQITIFLSLITMVITYGQLLINPYISRSIKSSGEYSMSLASRGIGGYTFIYFITLMGIIFLYYCIHGQNTIKKVASIVMYVFCIVFVIKSNYMTAFLVLIIGSCVLFLFAFRNSKYGLFFGVLVCIALIFIGINLNSIIGFVADFLPDRIARVLISGSDDSVLNSIVTEFLNDRWPTMLTSIQSYAKHPILGLVGSGDLVVNNNTLIGFGQHSYILDTFALFGTLGGVLNLYLLVKPFKFQWKTERNHDLDLSIFICMIILYLCNNASDSMALVTTIIYPYISFSMSRNKKYEVISYE